MTPCYKNEECSEMAQFSALSAQSVEEQKIVKVLVSIKLPTKSRLLEKHRLVKKQTVRLDIWR